MLIAAVPEGPIEVPSIVTKHAGGDTPVAVWRNTRGGLTFRLGDGAGLRRIGLFARLIAAIGVRDAVVYTFRPADRSHRHDARDTGTEAALLGAARRAGIVARYHSVEEFLHHRRGGTL